MMETLTNGVSNFLENKIKLIQAKIMYEKCNGRVTVINKEGEEVHERGYWGQDKYDVFKNCLIKDGCVSMTGLNEKREPQRTITITRNEKRFNL